MDSLSYHSYGTSPKCVPQAEVEVSAGSFGRLWGENHPFAFSTFWKPPAFLSSRLLPPSSKPTASISCLSPARTLLAPLLRTLCLHGASWISQSLCRLSRSLVTSAKVLSPSKGTDAQVPGMRTWTSLGPLFPRLPSAGVTESEAGAGREGDRGEEPRGPWRVSGGSSGAGGVGGAQPRQKL